MKRIILFATVILVMSIAVGCGKTVNESSQEMVVEDVETTSETNENVTSEMIVKDETATDETTVATEKTADKYQETALGNTINLDFTEIYLDRVSIDTEIYPKDTSGVYMYIPEISGKKYFQVIATLKNTSSSMYEIDNMKVKLIFDDEYNYDGYIEADAGMFEAYDYQVDPLESVDVHIIGEIPDELINSFQKCTITFGFKDDFIQVWGIEDCDYIYQLVYNK